MMTTSVTSTSYPMSDTSKQEYCRNNPSPPTSLTPLDSMDPFENSLSADTFLDSDFGSQGLSPAGSIHSSLYSDNQVVYQDYLLLDLMAYGLPATEGGSLPKLAQMLPYPSTTPSITLGTDENQARTLVEPCQGAAPDAYFQSQAIKDWSGACSTALSSENAPSPNSYTPQEAQCMSTCTSVDGSATQSLPSSNDWSTKNKLNLTVNTNMTTFKASDGLSPNYQNQLTSYSDSSYISASAPSFYFEPQHQDQVNHQVTSPANIANWLHGSLNAPSLNPGVGYFDGLPTPSSATFSAIPTPTGTSFPTDCAQLPIDANSALGININQPANFVLQLPTQSKPLLSPTNIDLTSGSGYLPGTGFVPQVAYGQYDITVNQFVNSPASYTSALDGRIDYFTVPSQVSSYPSRVPSASFDHASTFGHLASDSGCGGRLEHPPVHSGSMSMGDSHSAPMSRAGSYYMTRSEQGKRTYSQYTDSDDEQHPYKRRSSATSSDSNNENINPYQLGELTTYLKRAPLVGSRLKPGPKSKTTLVQHPPPGANLIGLNPCGETSGIPKDVLKCLYETVSGPSETGDGSIAKRYVCKLDDCGRSFPRKTAIESHIQTHLEDKPFVCAAHDCNAAFVRQHDLRRHEQIHSKSKPYGCACGKGFARGDALMRHRQRGICQGSLIPRRS
ncbi:hypothetical protein PSHT_03620 [Puccinia striiformis]|nr:hypothetical protein KEM48_005023 [Puccinia striiformis f. sp. tritici PST-130]KNE95296.1 hypothetical protein PSTG_11380 [Puccinia striiformis f. sp. tritici PST-78]POW20376.1 hypothetical protein PSHT_03620 [Puccinia striiformis]